MQNCDINLNKVFTVYIIRSIEGFRYIGMTEDLDNRIKQHNNHALSFWTKRGSGWRLVYSETFNDKSSALKKERWLKSGNGYKFMKDMGF